MPAIPLAKATPATDYQFQRSGDAAAPLLPNVIHNNLIVGGQNERGIATKLYSKKTTVKMFACCWALIAIAFVVCGYMFPGITSFIGDIIGLLLTALFGGVAIEVVLIGYNDKVLNKPYRFNCLRFFLAILLYPISYGCAAIGVAIICWQNRVKAVFKSIGLALLLFLFVIAVFFGSFYAVWDLFFNRYCIWQPIEFTSETCSPSQNMTLPLNYQLQGRYLQINNRMIYDAYKTTTNATDSIGTGPSLAVFGQSAWQRCSAPGAPWTYQDGQSVQMWNPINASNPYSGQWVHSADRTIIWEISQFLPYSIYHLFNCKNQLQYIVTTQTDFSTITMFDIKIHDKDNAMLASSKGQFSWTSFSMPFTKTDGELVGTLSQTLSFEVLRDHWNVNVKPEHQDYIEPYVYGHVASILKRSQTTHSSRRSSGSSRRRRSSFGSRRRSRL